MDKPLREPSPIIVPVMAYWATGLALGIALEATFAVPRWVATIALVTGGVFLLARWARERWRVLAAVVCAIALGALLHRGSARSVAANHIVQFTQPDPVLARVTGTIVDRPRISSAGYEPFTPWLYQQSRSAFLVEVKTIETDAGLVPTQGKLRVRVKEAALQVRSGAQVEVFGWLSRPLPPRNPGAFDWSRFQSRRGVYAQMTCERAECVRIEKEGVAAGESWRTALRRRLRSLLLDERWTTAGVAWRYSMPWYWGGVPGWIGGWNGRLLTPGARIISR
jgi:hypothetical protein